MNKNIFFKSIIVVLLLLNAALVLLLSGRFSKRDRFDGDRPRHIIIERLGFDKSQVMAYDKLIKQHRGLIRHKEAAIIDIKNRLYALLPETHPDTALVESYIRELGRKQEEIERVHFQHFSDIKALCRPEQQLKFRELSGDINEVFRSAHPKPHPKMP